MQAAPVGKLFSCSQSKIKSNSCGNTVTATEAYLVIYNIHMLLVAPELTLCCVYASCSIFHTEFITNLLHLTSFIAFILYIDYNPFSAVFQESPLIVSLTFGLTSVDDPTFVLTCTSTNRPPTYITWTRDGIELSDDSIHSLSQSLTDRELATYINTLTVMGRLPGQYVCHVTTEGWENQQTFTQSARKNITVKGQ